MQRRILTFVFVATACAALSAQQQANPQDPYQGQSNPPSDDTILVTEQPPQAKPSAAKPLVQPRAARTGNAAATEPVAHPTSVDPELNYPDPDLAGDDGIVQVARTAQGAGTAAGQGWIARNAAVDPDGDIVHPHPLGPGVLAEGTLIRARLLTMLSTADSRRGDEFRTRVATDVVQGGQVLIPAGAEIDGRVVQVSSGKPHGHGTMQLRPDFVVLLDGTRYRMNAQVTDTPGSNTHVRGEGAINAGSRYKKDGIEYGGGVGVGVVTGAVLGGPVGALAGGLIGAGAVTVHLLVDHPQAVLEPGAVLIFSLNDRLNLQGTNTAGD